MVKGMTYEEQLKTEQWRNKKEIILHRDMRLCQHCLTGKNLDVHHKYYLEGKMAWEYPDAALMTLCRSCHAHVHEWYNVPVKKMSLDVALERLVTVAQGVRDWCQTRFPAEDGKETE